MSWRYCGLSLILVAISCVRLLFSTLCAQHRLDSGTIASAALETDPESQLAQGEKISLELADVATLEMLEGMSDKLAFALVDKSATLQKLHREGISDVQALQQVRGIGEITARKLTRYLSLDSGRNLPF